MGLITIIGPPCAGKTTLGRGLARAEPSRHHVCVGDLIRADREEHGFAPSLEAAYQGRAEFPPEYLSTLILRESARIHVPPDRLILDGGPPLGAVGDLLGVPAELSLSLKCSDDVREDRFRARSRRNDRPDDAPELYRQRSSMYARRLPDTVEHLRARGPLIELDAGLSSEVAIFTALDALMMSAFVAPSPGGRPDRRVLGDLGAWVGSLGDYGRLWHYADGDFRVEDRHGALLLVKPGVRTTPALIVELVDRLAVHGLRIAEASQFIGKQVARHKLARAHFAEHYLIAAYGSTVLPGLVGGYEATRAFGPGVLARWEELAPRKVGHGLWVAELPLCRDRRVTVANGHIPRVVRQFEEDGARVLALRVVPSAGGVLDWPHLRHAFLGATDPAKAAEGSLRRDAFDGRLALGTDVSFQNNGFHLSDGPRSAARESLVWFGTSQLAPSDRDHLLQEVLVTPDDRTRTASHG